MASFYGLYSYHYTLTCFTMRTSIIMSTHFIPLFSPSLLEPAALLTFNEDFFFLQLVLSFFNSQLSEMKCFRRRWSFTPHTSFKLSLLFTLKSSGSRPIHFSSALARQWLFAGAPVFRFASILSSSRVKVVHLKKNWRQVSIPQISELVLQSEY